MKIGRWWRLMPVAALVGVLYYLVRQVDVQPLFSNLLRWIDTAGLFGVLLFVLVYILAAVLMLPGVILTLAAGFLYGVIQGTVVVSVASTLGAGCAFLIGRYLARDWVKRRMAGREALQAMDEAVGREGWKIVLLTRMSPAFPFNLINYAYGLTGVSFPKYFGATWLGMLPGTVLFVYLGSLAGELAAVGVTPAQRNPLEWLYYGLGLLATITVTVLVTRLARKALRGRFSLPDPHQGKET
ncbi:TVP38/TMEM64 family protein [Desulfuromonas sp. CSMB_57]|uniref:TVP38/TMEM64 family protein n=1 Tax=Desulfuromonas sp. CSMB_57 TaxID=2807629 RepID=UPI001CD6C04F|nr:TVP38/TMEM64 family protein [Desulfuromonas sp. CSMB_57]